MLKTVDKYVDAVISGKQVVGKYERLAVERHVRDLEQAKDRGWRFNERAAAHVLEFAQHLKHWKGEFAGKPLVFSPWQAFCKAVVFGWQKADGFRRFRTSWKEVARKNGKSTDEGTTGLYCFVADNEPGAEVYAAATKKDQARIVWESARNMVRQQPDLHAMIRIYHSNMNVVAHASKFEPLGADEDTLDGLNVHCALIDEIHAHKTRGVYDLIDTATGARRQSLISIITTAGLAAPNIGYELHNYSCQVLDGVIDDPQWFAYVATIDKDDDPFDEACWIKANPNLGVSVKIEDLREKAARAKNLSSYYNTFLRLHLNMWTQQVDKWIDVNRWQECKRDIVLDDFYGQPCWMAVDLSSTTDLTAVVLAFKTPDGPAVFSHFFVPENNATERAKRDRVPYLAWAKDGYLTLTPGDAVDYDFIEAYIHDIAERVSIQQIAMDPWNAQQVATNLGKAGLTVYAFRQGFGSMSGPSKQLEAMVASRKIQHDGNPVLKWCVANGAVAQDPAGNIKPDKSRSTERIDGLVALIMALGALGLSEGDGAFVYNRRGLFFA